MIIVVDIVLWDIGVICMYVYKLRTFKNSQKHHEHVYNRIMFILSRIVTISVFYDVLVLTIFTILSFVSHSGFSNNVIFVPVICSYSMYLMMEHNTKQYMNFVTAYVVYVAIEPVAFFIEVWMKWIWQTILATIVPLRMKLTTQMILSQTMQK